MACSSDDANEPLDIDEIIAQNDAMIVAYLDANNITAQSTPTGLYYSVDQEGNGTFPSQTSTIQINYRGYDLNGNVFDERENQSFPLPNLILGWQEGIPKFSVGGSGQLFIPAQLAYGGNDPSNFEPIIFDIELLGTN